MVFVIPAEIGHVPYAAPLPDYSLGHFATVHIVAVREKLYPNLSEDCWLLFADDFGGSSREIRISVLDRFVTSDEPPRAFESLDAGEWSQAWRKRRRSYGRPAGTAGVA